MFWVKQQANGQDGHSLTGYPLFMDINGADNVLGEQYVTEGNGEDVNFGLRKLSPAIDAGNAYVASTTDAEGRLRHDDPGSENTGAGWDYFIEEGLGGSLYTAGGTATGWRSTNGYWNYTLPFAFPFYGSNYSTVSVSSNGFLHFAGPDNPYGDSNSVEELARNVRIAPLWDNLRTDLTGGNIYVDASTAGQVTFRWAAKHQETGGDVNVSATLFSDGTIRFDYGPGNSGLTPTIGVSAGTRNIFAVSGYSGLATLENAASVMWRPTPGLTYYDLGAYEFQGNSNDDTPPTVAHITRLPDEGGRSGLTS